MNKELKAVVGHILQNNLAVLGAFIALSSAIADEQQQKLLESLDTMKNANQALLEMLNESKKS
ncbi:MAG: hypothetical protein V4637_19610 [Pseudomonadota bacterium]